MSTLERMALSSDKTVKSQAAEIRASSSNSVAALVDDKMMLFGAYRRPAVAKLERFLGVTSEWSDDHVVFHDVKPSRELGFVLSDLSVEMTSHAASELVLPSIESRLTSKWGAEAIAQGFATPTTFLKRFEYMPHQAESIAAVAQRGAVLLGHDTGLGKTGIFIGAYLALLQKEAIEASESDDEDPFVRGPLVIVTKVSLMPGAVRECAMWCPELEVFTMRGKARESVPDGTDIVIVSMDTLHDRVEDLLDTVPGGVVFDESHSYKNPTTKRSRAALKLAGDIRERLDHPYIVCATATPMPNRTEEVWTQLEMLGATKHFADHVRENMTVPDIVVTTLKSGGKSYKRKPNDKLLFDMYFCKGRATPYGWDNKGSAHENELNYLLYKHVMIRQLKSDVMVPMPMLTQNYVECRLTKEELDHYTVLKDDYAKFVRDKITANNPHLSADEIERLVKHKHSQIDVSELIMKMTDARVFVARAKIRTVVNWVTKFFAGDRLVTGGNSKRKKLVVFAYHKEIIEALITEPSFQKYGVTALKSGMTSKKIDAAVAEFQDPDGPKLIICYSGAREGVTLTAASDVLVTEIPFVPSWVIQMAGRCWARVSADYAPHPAWIHYAVAPGTIDIDLVKAFISKRRTIDEIMNIDEGDVAKDDFSDVLGIAAMAGA